MTNHASATNAGAATDEPLRPVADPVLLSSHLAAFEAPHERKTEMLPRKLCHDDVGKAGIVDTIRPACRIDDAVFSMWPMSNSGLPSAPLLCKCRVRLGSCRCIGLQSRPQLHWRNSSHRYRVGWSGDCCRPGDHGDHAAPTALSDTREKGFASSPSSCVSTLPHGWS